MTDISEILRNAAPRTEDQPPPETPVRVYHLTPAEAERYPVVHPTKQDFRDAAEAGWTVDRFVSAYGRDPKHTELLRRSYGTYLNNRAQRIRRGEEPEQPGDTDAIAVASGAGLGTEGMLHHLHRRKKAAPQMRAQAAEGAWTHRAAVVLREHPDWTSQQVAEALGTTTGTVRCGLARAGTTLTELRDRVKAELAATAQPEPAADPPETVDAGPETVDPATKPPEVNSIQTTPALTLDTLKAIMVANPTWGWNQFIEYFGVGNLKFGGFLKEHDTGIKVLRAELGLQQIHGKRKAKASEPPAEPANCDICGGPTGAGREQHASDCLWAPPPTCPACDRPIPDCDHEGDCERSGRHADSTEQPDPSPLHCPECQDLMEHHDEWSVCPERDPQPETATPPLDVPEELIRHDAPDMQFVSERPLDPAAIAAAHRPRATPDPRPLPGTVEHLVAGTICGTCIKSDVCRHLPTLTSWIERVDSPDLGIDIEYDVVVRRCEAWRGEVTSWTTG